MPRGHYQRKPKEANHLTQFLPQTGDLNRSYAHYRREFEQGMAEIMGAVKKVSMAMTRLEAMHEIARETMPEPNTHKYKNRHQIQKICPSCSQPKDPRGFKAHVRKCERVMSQRKLLMSGISKDRGNGHARASAA